MYKQTTRKAALILTLAISLGLAACQKTQTKNQAETDTETKVETQSELKEGEFDTSFLEMGQQIAKTRCAFCHAAGPTGTSPRADAPPLRTVLANYNTSALADDFREHIHVGHPDMPDFGFTVKQTEGLLAYLTSIQETSE